MNTVFDSVTISPPDDLWFRRSIPISSFLSPTRPR
jgi:hypothetical protein